MKRLIIFVLFIIALFLTENVIAQGCSQCKMLAEQGSEVDENSFGSSINTGILYLMIIPYLILMFLFREKIIGFLKSRLKNKH
jgi:hypothetical protein